MQFHRNLCHWKCCKWHWWYIYADSDVNKPRRCGVTIFGHAFFWRK